MVFTPPKPGGWAPNELLTALQVTALQSGVSQVDADVIAEVSRSLLSRARQLSLDLNSVTPSDTSASLGVCSAFGAQDVLLVKGTTNGAFRVVDSSLVIVSGVTVASVTSQVRKVVRSSTNTYLAVGSGGNRNAVSANHGASWTAGGASTLAADPIDCVWDGTEFIMSTAGGDSAHSTTGAAWTNAASDISAVLIGGSTGGLAVLSGGFAIAAGQNGGGDWAFARSVNHGATWVGGGSIPSSATYPQGGWLAGNGGAEVYWLGNAITGNRLDFFASSNGTTWEKRSEISIQQLDSGLPKLFMCQDTGLLLAAAPRVSSGIAIALSDDLGESWTDFGILPVTSVNAIGVARGRVFSTVGAKLFGGI